MRRLHSYPGPDSHADDGHGPGTCIYVLCIVFPVSTCSNAGMNFVVFVGSDGRPLVKTVLAGVRKRRTVLSCQTTSSTSSLKLVRITSFPSI